MLKWIGGIILALGVIVLGSDLYVGMSDEFRLIVLGEWWAGVHRDSLLLTQSAIQRYISSDLWDVIVQPLLETSLAIQLIALGLLILGLGRFFSWRGQAKRRTSP